MKNKQNKKLVEGKKYHKDQGRNKWNRKKKTTEKKTWYFENIKKNVKTFSLTHQLKKKKRGSKSVTWEIKMENFKPTLKKQRGS